MSKTGIRKQFQKLKHKKKLLQTNNEQETIKNKQWVHKLGKKQEKAKYSGE